jgi:hypothetical protein
MTARILSRDGSFGGEQHGQRRTLRRIRAATLHQGRGSSPRRPASTSASWWFPPPMSFDGIVQTAQRLESSAVATGISNKLSLDEQGKLTGDAWERLPEPRPRLRLQVYEPNGTLHDYRLGPHTPRLRQEDVDVLHRVWLDVTREPELSSDAPLPHRAGLGGGPEGAPRGRSPQSRTGSAFRGTPQGRLREEARAVTDCASRTLEWDSRGDQSPTGCPVFFCASLRCRNLFGSAVRELFIGPSSGRNRRASCFAHGGGDVRHAYSL